MESYKLQGKTSKQYFSNILSISYEEIFWCPVSIRIFKPFQKKLALQCAVMK